MFFETTPWCTAPMARLFPPRVRRYIGPKNVTYPSGSTALSNKPALPKFLAFLVIIPKAVRAERLLILRVAQVVMRACDTISTTAAPRSSSSAVHSDLLCLLLLVLVRMIIIVFARTPRVIAGRRRVVVVLVACSLLWRTSACWSVEALASIEIVVVILLLQAALAQAAARLKSSRPTCCCHCWC